MNKQHNSKDINRLKVKTKITKTYYVEYGNSGDIYGGPFETREEALQCLHEAKTIDAQHPVQ